MKSIFAGLVVIFIAANALAEKPCTFRENVRYSLSMNGQAEDIQTVEKLLQEKLQQVIQLSKEADVGETNITEKNYSINSQMQYDKQVYSYNFTLGFTIKSEEKAISFMKLLTKHNLPIRLSVNQHRNCSFDEE